MSVLEVATTKRTRAYAGMSFEVHVAEEKAGHRWECLVFGAWRSVGGFGSVERAFDDASVALDKRVGQQGRWETDRV